MLRVRRSAKFARDLDAQVAFLVAGDDLEGIDRLELDLAAVEQLLSTFPDAGRELGATESWSLRKLKLRRCPFVVWYQRESGQLTLARLFHARQDQPKLT